MASTTPADYSTPAQVTGKTYIVSYIFRAPSSGSGTWQNKRFNTVEEASAHCLAPYKEFLELYELPERWEDYTFDWDYEDSPTIEMADKLFSPKKISQKLADVRKELQKATYDFKLPSSHAVLFGPYDCDSGLIPFEIVIREI